MAIQSALSEYQASMGALRGVMSIVQLPEVPSKDKVQAAMEKVKSCTAVKQKLSLAKSKLLGAVSRGLTSETDLKVLSQVKEILFKKDQKNQFVFNADSFVTLNPDQVRARLVKKMEILEKLEAKAASAARFEAFEKKLQEQESDCLLAVCKANLALRSYQETKKVEFAKEFCKAAATIDEKTFTLILGAMQGANELPEGAKIRLENLQDFVALRNELAGFANAHVKLDEQLQSLDVLASRASCFTEEFAKALQECEEAASQLGFKDEEMESKFLAVQAKKERLEALDQKEMPSERQAPFFEGASEKETVLKLVKQLKSRSNYWDPCDIEAAKAYVNQYLKEEVATRKANAHTSEHAQERYQYVKEVEVAISGCKGLSLPKTTRQASTPLARVEATGLQTRVARTGAPNKQTILALSAMLMLIAMLAKITGIFDRP